MTMLCITSSKAFTIFTPEIREALKAGPRHTKTPSIPLTLQSALQSEDQSLFDAGFYHTAYDGVPQNRAKALIHYVREGYLKGYNPSTDFDGAFYEKIYLKDWKGAWRGEPKNPLLHYLTEGRAKGAPAHPKFMKKPQPLENPTYYLCLAAIFRDEARFLKEWIEYYLMMGVEHFFLTNHLSKDNYMEVLQPYVDQGVVTLREEKEEKKSAAHRFQIQNRAYYHAVEWGVHNVDWLFICDTDEFLATYEEDTFADLLRNYEDCAAASFHWKMFGMSNVQKLSSTDLLLEKMTKSSKSQDLHNRWFKTAFRPRCCNLPKTKHMQTLFHRPVLLKKFYSMDVKRNPLPFGAGMLPTYCSLPIPSDVARLHHYCFRDRFFLTNVKLKWIFRQKTIKSFLQKEKSWNVEVDTTMMRFVPELRRRMGLDAVTTPQESADTEEVAPEPDAE